MALVHGVIQFVYEEKFFSTLNYVANTANIPFYCVLIKIIAVPEVFFSGLEDWFFPIPGDWQKSNPRIGKI